MAAFFRATVCVILFGALTLNVQCNTSVKANSSTIQQTLLVTTPTTTTSKTTATSSTNKDTATTQGQILGTQTTSPAAVTTSTAQAPESSSAPPTSTTTTTAPTTQIEQTTTNATPTIATTQAPASSSAPPTSTTTTTTQASSTNGKPPTSTTLQTAASPSASASPVWPNDASSTGSPSSRSTIAPARSATDSDTGISASKSTSTAFTSLSTAGENDGVIYSEQETAAERAESRRTADRILLYLRMGVTGIAAILLLAFFSFAFACHKWRVRQRRYNKNKGIQLQNGGRGDTLERNSLLSGRPQINYKNPAYLHDEPDYPVHVVRKGLKVLPSVPVEPRLHPPANQRPRKESGISEALSNSHTESARDSLVELVSERVRNHPENETILHKLADEKGVSGDDGNLHSLLDKLPTGDLLRAYEDMQKLKSKPNSRDILTDL